MENKRPRDNSVQDSQRRKNLHTVMLYCLEHGGCSKREMCVGTGLSWGLISRIANDLTKRGFLEVTAHDRLPGSGRNASGFVASENRYVSFGISVEKGRFILSVISLKGSTLYKIERMVDTSSKEKVIASLYSIVEEGLSFMKKNDKELLSIGLSVSSYVRPNEGTIVHFPGLSKEEWDNVDVCSLLRGKYNVPSFVERDGACLLFEEFVKEGTDDKALLLLDNSLSFGLMRDGRMVLPSSFWDLGHTMYGPFEGKGMLTLSNIASVKGLSSRLGVSEEGLFSHPETYKEELMEVGRYLGLAIQNVHRLVRLKNIVFAGRLFELKDYFLEGFYSSLGEHLGVDAKKEFGFSFAKSNDGSNGAALLSMREGLDEALGKR